MKANSKESCVRRLCCTMLIRASKPIEVLLCFSFWEHGGGEDSLRIHPCDLSASQKSASFVLTNPRQQIEPQASKSQKAAPAPPFHSAATAKTGRGAASTPCFPPKKKHPSMRSTPCIILPSNHTRAPGPPYPQATLPVPRRQQQQRLRLSSPRGPLRPRRRPLHHRRRRHPPGRPPPPREREPSPRHDSAGTARLFSPRTWRHRPAQGQGRGGQ